MVPLKHVQPIIYPIIGAAQGGWVLLDRAAASCAVRLRTRPWSAGPETWPHRAPTRTQNLRRRHTVSRVATCEPRDCGRVFGQRRLTGPRRARVDEQAGGDRSAPIAGTRRIHARHMTAPVFRVRLRERSDHWRSRCLDFCWSGEGCYGPTDQALVARMNVKRSQRQWTRALLLFIILGFQRVARPWGCSSRGSLAAMGL